MRLHIQINSFIKMEFSFAKRHVIQQQTNFTGCPKADHFNVLVGYRVFYAGCPGADHVLVSVEFLFFLHCSHKLTH